MSRTNASLAVRFCIGILLLGGCAGQRSNAPIIPTGAFVSPAANAAARSGDLLYIAHNERMENGHYRGVLSFFTFPQGEAVQDVTTPGIVLAACSDASGNVWAIVSKQKRWNAYEYAHGGTMPIASIDIPPPRPVSGCAVDPTTGNFAVTTGAYQGSGHYGKADVWVGGRNGKPARYTVPFTPTACAYDGAGNLFVDGWIGSTVFFDLAELAEGGNAFATVKLNKSPYLYPGGMAWDGRYLAIVDYAGRRTGNLWRIKISGSNGTVVGISDLERLYSFSVLAVKGGIAVGTTRNDGDAVALWRYPSGGKAIKTITQYAQPTHGVTISVGSH